MREKVCVGVGVMKKFLSNMITFLVEQLTEGAYMENGRHAVQHGTWLQDKACCCKSPVMS